jgi:hypothetical protein
MAAFTTPRHHHNAPRTTQKSLHKALPSTLDPNNAAIPPLLTDAIATTTPQQEFEPIINLPALSAFLLISIVFTLLQIRINAVSRAAQRRSRALDALRIVESLQLSGGGSDNNASGVDMETRVIEAKKEYENALREELDLRTILPYVRIVAPNDPKRDEEQRGDYYFCLPVFFIYNCINMLLWMHSNVFYLLYIHIAAAKRFLGWDYATELFDDERELIEGSGSNTADGPSTGLSGGARAVLFGVATVLLALLYTLSFDPMGSSWWIVDGSIFVD